jgi:hypothetical protein
MSIFISVGEKLKALNQDDAADSIWTFLRDKAPSDSIAAKISKMHLEKEKTEFEKVWR